jgi:hypothetical protein
MSVSLIFNSISLPTTTDFSELQYTAVSINSSGDAIGATSAVNCLGIIQNTPDGSTDTAASIAVSGISRAVLGGTVTVGEQLQVGSNGALVVLDGGTAVALALQAGASGDTVSVYLTIANGAYTS